MASKNDQTFTIQQSNPAISQVRRRSKSDDIRVILVISCSLLMFGATYSHLASFFAEYNSLIGNSPLEYGLVMGTYPFAQILTGPFATKVSTWNLMSDKQLLISSLLVDGIFCMLPALLNFMHIGNRAFLYLMFLTRIIQSVGGTTGSVLVYIINGVELPHLTHVMIPILETVYGVSVVVGPALSATLKDFLGINAPFLALGLMDLTLALATVFLLPKTSSTSESHGSAKFKKATKPSVLLNILTTINAFAMLSYNETTLSSQLEPFKLSTTVVGLIFVFPAGTYAVSSLYFGFQINRFSDPRLIIIGGSFISVVAMLGMGPLMELFPNLWVLLICQALFGLGAGPAFVCSYLHSVREINKGKESKEALAVVTGLMEPSVAMGNLFGSLFAGWMLDKFSFTTGIISNILTLSLIAVMQSILVARASCAVKKNNPA